MLCQAAAIAATLEDAREKGELQRAYFSLLSAAVQNGLSAALPAMPPGGFDAVMAALARSAATHVDPAVRRSCMQVR
jgi:exportin-T